MGSPDKIRRMIRQLEEALSEAISDSSSVTHTLRQIRDEGYSLYLKLDARPARDAQEAPPVPRLASPGGGEPDFLINGPDLYFLRSIGIDPTRQLRRRKGG
jgi:hypothetical protein